MYRFGFSSSSDTHHISKKLFKETGVVSGDKSCCSGLSDNLPSPPPSFPPGLPGFRAHHFSVMGIASQTQGPSAPALTFLLSSPLLPVMSSKPKTSLCHSPAEKP